MNRSIGAANIMPMIKIRTDTQKLRNLCKVGNWQNQLQSQVLFHFSI